LSDKLSRLKYTRKYPERGGNKRKINDLRKRFSGLMGV
jgi:hypothetical protein